MLYSLHYLLQRRKAAPQPRFLGAHPNLEVTFSVSRAIERQAQEVDSFRAVPAAFASVSLREPTKLNQLGLGRLQSESELPQPLTQGILYADGVRSILETDHKVIDVAHQSGFAPQPNLDDALEPEVEHVMEVHVAQEHANRSTLRGSLLARMNRSIFQDARFQPTPDQADQARIADSMFDKSEHPIVIEAPEEVLQIRLQHPANHAAGDDLIEGRQGVMGAELGSAAERAGQEVLLVDGGQHLSRGALERPVGDSWNPEGALLRLARLGDIDPPNVRRAISLAVDGLEHRLYPALEPLLRRLHRLTIHPGGGSLRNL